MVSISELTWPEVLGGAGSFITLVAILFQQQVRQILNLSVDQVRLTLIGGLVVFLVIGVVGEYKRRKHHPPMADVTVTTLPPDLTNKEVPLLGERVRTLARAELPQIREETLGDVRAMLHRLPARHWNMAMRKAAFAAFAYIADSWPGLTLQQKSDFLFTILMTLPKDKKTFTYMKERFSTIAESSYRIPELEQEPIKHVALGVNALRMVQEFREHSEKYELEIADESMEWGNGKWQNLWAAIELSQTKKTDDGTFQRMREHFESLRVRYEKEGDSEGSKRAAAFFGQIRNQA